MSIRMSEEDKNSMLDQALPEGEEYLVKLRALIMCGLKDLTTIGMFGGFISGVAGLAVGGRRGAMEALSNEHCYVGMTENGIVVCVIHREDCSKLKISFEIPFDQMKDVDIKDSIIPGRSIVYIYLFDGQIKLTIMSTAIGTNIKYQKKNAEYFIDNIF